MKVQHPIKMIILFNPDFSYRFCCDLLRLAATCCDLLRLAATSRAPKAATRSRRVLRNTGLLVAPTAHFLLATSFAIDWIVFGIVLRIPDFTNA